MKPISDPGGAGHWIDLEEIPAVGAYSGGEQRLLRIAASLGGGVLVDLAECITGLDREHVDLVLAALSHARGTHEGREIIFDHEAGTVSPGQLYTALHPWPGAGQ